MRWVTVTGRIMYDPVREDLRKESRDTPWWVIAQLTGRELEDFSAYYRWILRMRGVGMIAAPAWKPHVTILDGRHVVDGTYMHAWKKHDGEIVEFEYGVDIYKQWKFWALPVRCPKFDEIRKELGFTDPYPYHITVGREYDLSKKG